MENKPNDDGQSAQLPGYWKAYGGLRATLLSPFPPIAAIATAVCYPYWSKDGWWAVVTTVLPCILGFTIAAFALVLGLGGDSLKRQLHHRNRRTNIPLYLKISAIFAHQIIIQTAAILVAIVVSAVWMYPAPTTEALIALNHAAIIVFWGLGFFLFVYSVLLVFAGAMNIYALARMIQRAADKSSQNTAVDKLPVATAPVNRLRRASRKRRQ